MPNSFANKCIRCTVSECKNHNTTQDFCSLDSIVVGTHESNPTMNECTDCQSFVPKCCN